MPVTGRRRHAAERAAEHHADARPATGRSSSRSGPRPGDSSRARPLNNATVKTRDVDGKRLRVVTLERADEVARWPELQGRGLHQRRQPGRARSNTWVEHAIFGDLLVESEYSFYRENDGLKYPTEIVQRAAAGRCSMRRSSARCRIRRSSRELMAIPAPPAGAGGPPGGPPGGAAPRRTPRSSPTACIASRARTTRWRSSSPTTCC